MKIRQHLKFCKYSKLKRESYRITVLISQSKSFPTAFMKKTSSNDDASFICKRSILVRKVDLEKKKSCHRTLHPAALMFTLNIRDFFVGQCRPTLIYSHGYEEKTKIKI